MGSIESGKNYPQGEPSFGEQLKAVRETFGYSRKDVADLSGISRQSVQGLETRDTLPQRSKTTELITGFLSLSDMRGSYQAMELRERLTESVNQSESTNEEQQNWLRTIHTLPFGMALRVLRLSDRIYQESFGQEAEINPKAINGYEQGKQRMQPHTLNSLIEASSINPQGYPSQLLRLKNKNEEPMSFDELATCPFSRLFGYSLDIAGLSTREMDKHLPKKVSRNVLTGRIKKVASIAEQVPNILDLPFDDPMREIIQQKANTSQITITDEGKQRLVTGRYLFADQVTTIDPYQISDSDRALIGRLNRGKTSVLAIVNGFKKRRGREISTYKIPADSMIVLTAGECGYNIHHPVTHALLQQAEQERKQRRLDDIISF
jgi:transcriptional regulator with XRE-family HTH domain